MVTYLYGMERKTRKAKKTASSLGHSCMSVKDQGKANQELITQHCWRNVQCHLGWWHRWAQCGPSTNLLWFSLEQLFSGFFERMTWKSCQSRKALLAVHHVESTWRPERAMPATAGWTQVKLDTGTWSPLLAHRFPWPWRLPQISRQDSENEMHNSMYL